MAEPSTTEILLACNSCGKPVKPAYQDDAKTQWYRCETGHITATPNKRELDPIAQLQVALCDKIQTVHELELNALVPLSLDPKLEERFIADLNRTVKSDNHVASVVFHVALSAYLDAGNLAVKGTSGAGKSYGTTETLSYFPPEDVWLIGSQSPKVISHERGELMTGNDEPLDLSDAPVKPDKREIGDPQEFAEAMQEYKLQKKAWEEKLKSSYNLIRLGGKILVFLEPPSRDTFNMLKCTLSHDTPRITHKYVDDKGRVHVAVLEGWPSAVFCSVDREYMEEFATRVFTVTPNTDKAKIEAANEVSNLRKCYPWEYENATSEKQLIRTLLLRIREAVRKRNLKVINPFPNLHIFFDSDAARDMRDFTHFLQLMQSFTLFKLYQRPTITIGQQEYIVSTLIDVQAAKALFDEIVETTQTGTDKRILDFYHRYVKKYIAGATLDLIAESYNMDPKNRKNQLGDATIRFWLRRLNKINWVQIKKGEVEFDKRKDMFYPLKNVEDASRDTEISETTLKSQIKVDLTSELEKSFETWLKTISLEGSHLRIGINNLFDECTQEITLDQFKKIILCKTDTATLIVSKPESSAKIENNPETNLKRDFKLVSLNSDTFGNLNSDSNNPNGTTKEENPE